MKNFVLLTAFSIFMYCSLQANVDTTIEKAMPQEMGMVAGKFAYLVARRYYFIQRLTPIITMLLQAGNININPAAVLNHNGFDVFDLAQFKHHRIKRSIQEIRSYHNIKPLFMVWEDFVAYKSIEDQVFIEDFTKEVLVVSLSISHPHITPLPTKSSQKQSLESFSNISLEQTFELLDQIYGTSQKPPKRYYYEKPPTQTTLEKDLDFFVTLNDIALRFFINMRLERPIEIIQKANRYIPLFNVMKNLSESKPVLTHPKIKACFDRIQQHQDITPLVKLMHDSLQFKYIKEDLFNRDYLRLIFYMYKQLIIENPIISLSRKPSTLQLITQIYQNLESLPLEEILDAIDMISEELPPLLEKYEIKKEMSWQEWKKWLKKYWWVPPGILFVFGIKVALILRGTPHHRPPHPPNQPQHPAVPPQAPSNQPVYGEYE